MSAAFGWIRGLIFFPFEIKELAQVRIEIKELVAGMYQNQEIGPRHVSKSRNWSEACIQIKELVHIMYPNQGTGP